MQVIHTPESRHTHRRATHTHSKRVKQNNHMLVSITQYDIVELCDKQWDCQDC